MSARWVRLARCVVVLAACLQAPVFAQNSTSNATVERGRYLVIIGHCNNCHTPGYNAKAGEVPESLWLTGNPVGWRSNAGTTYASNLRITMQALPEESWLQVARNAKWRAPMPWWSLRDTNDDDLRAMYRYIRSLAPIGNPAPGFLPPEQTPPRPYNQLPDMS